MSNRANSPSPDFSSVNTSKFHSIARSGTRATSEERSEIPEGSPSPDSSSVFTQPSRKVSEAMAYRDSRAASEEPERDHIDFRGARPDEIRSARSSRAGSEAPERFEDVVSARSSRAGSEAPQRFEGLNDSTRSSRAESEVGRGTPPPGGSAVGSPKQKKFVPQPPSAARKATVTPAQKSSYTNLNVDDCIREVEDALFHTVTTTINTNYSYYQSLHYPLNTDKLDEPSHQPTQTSGSSATSAYNSSSKEPSPGPRLSGSSDGPATNNSPSPSFDQATFNATYEGGDSFLNESGEMLASSFNVPLHTEESMQPSISVLMLTTLPDPISGAPVLSVCLGDYSGHVEYFEVGVRDADNKRIQKSRSMAKSASRPTVSMHRDPSSDTRDFRSIESRATENIVQDMRGREVARRHSHKAYIKSINALTSVAVEPAVKCLEFIRPYSSPSMVSYLTANERVIKLFHVRREGFTPFSVFPNMVSVIGETFMGSRYFARMPPQSVILPIREFGPSQNCIQALSVSADAETFMSVEDLQVFWWHLESNDPTKATCIADLRPPSGALDEVEELVTAASFHPTHSSLFMLSRSSGVLNIGDLRDPPSREKRNYAITTQVKPSQNPTSCQAYDEILCSISAASFLGPDHVITRDYLSLKLWDLRRPDTPYSMVPVMDYVTKFLDPLYENDSIFDRFPVAVDDVSGTVVTGLYDGAVAVWQPSNKSLKVEEQLSHYRVDPNVEPKDAPNGAKVTVDELSKRLANSWSSSATPPDEGSAEGYEDIPEPFTNKVLNVAIAPGGERFAYTYKNGQLVYFLERVQ